MTATLTFQLPEEEPEHRYALAGTDALLLIEDLCSEIRAKLKYDSGDFKEFQAEKWDEERSEFVKITAKGDDHTLEKIVDWIYDQKQRRNLPELV